MSLGARSVDIGGGSRPLRMPRSDNEPVDDPESWLSPRPSLKSPRFFGPRAPRNRPYNAFTTSDMITNARSVDIDDKPHASRTPSNDVKVLQTPGTFSETLSLMQNKFASKAEKELLIGAFVDVFQDKSRYKCLLEFRDENAQIILDALQILLDYTQDSLFSNRGSFMRALLRLSKRSNLYPQCFTLHDIKHSGFAIAEGHFGEVWKGDLRGSNMCLKVLKAYYNSDISKLLNAYTKEAILWSQLSHPNLLPFYGVHHLGDELGRICLVSPWMDNGNINVYLKRYPDANRLYLLKEIARGTSYLHYESINIVHGDLKGANILVTSSGRPCLCDFGLSSMIDSEVLKWSSLQSTVTTGGTTRWQAPELFDPAADHVIPTKETDVYAFGCVCYEVLTGKVPFYETFRDPPVMLKIMKGENPTRPDLQSRAPESVFSRGLTEEMWNLMRDCWKFDPTERPNINEVLTKIPTNSTDPRPGQSWKEMSSARFRKTMENKFNLFSTNDARAIMGLLNEL